MFFSELALYQFIYLFEYVYLVWYWYHRMVLASENLHKLNNAPYITSPAVDEETVTRGHWLELSLQHIEVDG